LKTNSHKTEITVAIIGLIGVLGTAAIANWDKIFSPRPGDQPTQFTNGTAPSSQDWQSPGIGGCFGQYFSGLPEARIKTLEAGARDFQLIEPNERKDQAIGIQLRENGQPVGAVTFQFYSENTFFKIGSAVDSQCQRVEDYANASRGGDKHNLQNWDDLRIRLAGGNYTLTLEYDAGKIDATFARVSP
jgi:hypothetical protein